MHGAKVKTIVTVCESHVVYNSCKNTITEYELPV